MNFSKRLFVRYDCPLPLLHGAVNIAAVRRIQLQDQLGSEVPHSAQLIAPIVRVTHRKYVLAALWGPAESGTARARRRSHSERGALRSRSHSFLSPPRE